VFYSESAGATVPAAACNHRLAHSRLALAEAQRTLSLARLRVVAAHQYAACNPAAARCRGARRVAPHALLWHQQMRQLDMRMLAPERLAPLRNVWSLTRVLANGWARWISRAR
jgi:hypothetical protein